MTLKSDDEIRFFTSEVEDLKSSGTFDDVVPYVSHYLLSIYYAIKHDRDSALSHANAIETKSDRYEALVDVYRFLGDYENMCWTMSANYALKDSMRSATLSEQLAKKDAELDNTTLRFETEQLRLRNKITIIVAISVIALIILSITIITSILRHRRLQQQKRLLEEEVARQTAELRTKNKTLEDQKEEISTQYSLLESQNDLLELQKDEIIAQNEALEQKNTLINDINQDLTVSILYASHIQSAILSEIKGTKRSVGDCDAIICRTLFVSTTIPVSAGDALYMYSDGFTDQFGANGSRLKSTGLRKWLDEVKDLPFPSQGPALESRLHDWMKDSYQVDDICMLALQF